MNRYQCVACDYDICQKCYESKAMPALPADSPAMAMPEPQAGPSTKFCPAGHPLNPLGTTKDTGWLCSGTTQPGGCRGGTTTFLQTMGMNRYQCEICDYDLCQQCYEYL